MSSSSAGFGSVSAFSFHCDLPWCHERFPVYLQISFLSPPTPTTSPTWAKEKSLLPVLMTARSCWRQMWVQQSACGVASQSDQLQPGRHSWPQGHQPPDGNSSSHRAGLVLHALNAGKEAGRRGRHPPFPSQCTCLLTAPCVSLTFLNLPVASVERCGHPGLQPRWEGGDVQADGGRHALREHEVQAEAAGGAGRAGQHRR